MERNDENKYLNNIIKVKTKLILKIRMNILALRFLKMDL